MLINQKHVRGANKVKNINHSQHPWAEIGKTNVKCTGIKSSQTT